MELDFKEVVRCPKCKRFIEKGTKCKCEHSLVDDLVEELKETKNVINTIKEKGKESLWIKRYAILFSSIVIIGIFVEYMLLSENANRHFNSFNFAIFLVGLTAIFVFMLVIVNERTREETLTIHKLLFLLGAIFILSVFLIPIFTKSYISGLAIPMIIFVGIILILISKFSMDFTEIILILILSIGVLLGIFGPVLDAYGFIDSSIYLVATGAGIIVISLIIMCLLRTFQALLSTKVYITIWLEGVFASISASYHEAYGIIQSGSFGILDFTLIGLGLALVCFSLFLFLVKELRDSRADKFIEQGEKNYETRNFSEALYSFESALNIDKNKVRAWLGLALTHEHLGEHEEALRCYSEITRMISDEPNALAGIARVQRRLGLHEESLRNFEKAIDVIKRKEPTNIKALSILYSGKGILLFRMGRDNEALKAFDEAISLDPENIDAICNKGIVLYLLGDNTGAKKNLEKVLDISQKNEVAKIYYERILSREHIESKRYSKTVITI
ncbi:MAG: tetratricopeptide repeat protein [Thermoplasmata archaeon]